MQLTEEQKKILETVKDPNQSIIKISARAGAGKTAILSYIAKELGTSGVYLAYNKSIATEAQSKFPNKIKCSTIHSLAYQNTVKPLKLSLGYFGYRDIKEYTPFIEKVIILDIIELFFSSKYTTFDEYKNDHYYIEKRNLNKSFLADHGKLFTIAKKYISKMFAKKIPITHSGYLKMFHLLLANDQLKIDTELLMIDEAGDLVPVTYAIFKLINANKKIIAGDEYQTIYTFNNTINAFNEDSDGITLQMTKSFRCNDNVAKLVQAFMQQYVDKNFRFEGVNICDKEPDSIAYISRTNSAMIGTMIDFSQSKINFNLTRSASQIFDLVLSLLSLKPGYTITIPDYLWLNDELHKYWNSNEIQKLYDSALGFIAEEFAGDDPGLKISIGIIGKYGPTAIYETYNHAKQLEKSSKKYKLTLTTAHACKGLEFDKVIINEDMNIVLEKVMNKIENGEELDENDRAEFLLYYVACSRAKKELIGARYAEQAIEILQEHSIRMEDQINLE